MHIWRLTDATLHRFTSAEYHLMGETGILPPGARVELLDGQFIDMFPTGPFHGGTVLWLTQFFSEASNDRWLVGVQGAIKLNEFYEPQPDLILLRPRPDFYRKATARPKDVRLLIEVSDSS